MKRARCALIKIKSSSVSKIHTKRLNTNAHKTNFILICYTRRIMYWHLNVALFFVFSEITAMVSNCVHPVHKF